MNIFDLEITEKEWIEVFPEDPPPTPFTLENYIKNNSYPDGGDSLRADAFYLLTYRGDHEGARTAALGIKSETFRHQLLAWDLL